MAEKGIFWDYITPIKETLKGKSTAKAQDLRKLIYHSRKILFKHTYRNYSVDQAVERLLKPSWIKNIRGFDPEEWEKTAALVYERARKLIRLIPKPDILLYPSFGGSNGRVYKLDKKPIMGLSPDFGFCKGENLKCMMAHEYAHFMRYRKIGTPPEKQKIYSHIYEEGWAIFMTRRIFPKKPSDIVFMSNLHHAIGLPNPQGGYIRWCKKHLKEIAAAALPVLSSNSFVDTKRFFQCGRFKRGNTPIRVGYYLGAEMMENLAKDHSIHELYRLKPNARIVGKWLEGIISRI